MTVSERARAALTPSQATSRVSVVLTRSDEYMMLGDGLDAFDTQQPLLSIQVGGGPSDDLQCRDSHGPSQPGSAWHH